MVHAASATQHACVWLPNDRAAQRHPATLPGDALLCQARILVQVADGAQAEHVPPALPAMFGRVVAHVAALAERGEVARQIVPRIMVEVRACQDDIGGPDRGEFEAIADRHASPAVGPPASGSRIPPAPVAEMRDEPKMRPRAAFTSRTGPVEPDRIGQLLPVERIEPAVLGADRHDDSMSQSGLEQKGKFDNMSKCRNVDLMICRCVGLAACRQFDM